MGFFLGGFSNRVLQPAVPRLLGFVTTAGNLGLLGARLGLYDAGVAPETYPREEASMYTLDMRFRCSSAAHVFDALSPVRSPVDYPTLEYERKFIASEGHNQADSVPWRSLLRSFPNGHVGTGVL